MCITSKYQKVGNAHPLSDGHFVYKLLFASTVWVNGRVTGIEVLGIEMFLNNAKCFAKALEVNNFSCTKETNRVSNLVVFDDTENVVVDSSCFLLCCKHPRTAICLKIGAFEEQRRSRKNFLRYD